MASMFPHYSVCGPFFLKGEILNAVLGPPMLIRDSGPERVNTPTRESLRKKKRKQAGVCEMECGAEHSPTQVTEWWNSVTETLLNG